MKKSLTVLIIILCLLSNLTNAQELNNKKAKPDFENVTNKIDGVSATNDKMTLKDGTTTLLEVTNEGEGGSIYFEPLPADITSFDNKLYNVGTELYWSGAPLGTSRNVGWETSSSLVRLNSISDKVGIGINSPSAKLHVFGDDGVLFEGTYGSGTIPKEGSGTRMMWYPKKAAFRCGHLEMPPTDWDDINIGSFSVAMGINTKASGYASVALGQDSKATAIASTAFGESTTASGIISTAMGAGTKAEALYSTAIGILNIGGGSSDVWVPTDPIFEIGIGSDGVTRENALTVLKNGNVGIGTENPESDLGIERNDDAFTGITITNTNSGSQSSEGIYFDNEDGSIAGIRLYDDDATYPSQMSLFNSRPNGSIHLLSETGKMVLDKTGNLAIYSGDILTQGTNSFQSSGDEAALFLGDNYNHIKAVYGFGLKIGTFGVVNSAMSILSGSGNVGIGTETPSYKLEVNGDAAKSSGGTAWSVSSDRRLKDIHGNYEKGLEDIISLEPKNFNYKKDNSRDLPFDTEEIGFIAQEVQEVFPEAVNEGKDGYLDFNMHPINVAMVNAIKDQQKIINELKNRIIKLENLINSPQISIKDK